MADKPPPLGLGNLNKLLHAGLLGKIEMINGRFTCGGYEMAFSAERLAVAAELGIDLSLYGAPPGNQPGSVPPANPSLAVERSIETREVWFPNRPMYEHFSLEALGVLDDFAWTIYCLRSWLPTGDEDEPLIDSAACGHFGYLLTYTPDPGGPHGSQTLGVETCSGCGSSRRVEGDHAGPWFRRGMTPARDA